MSVTMRFGERSKVWILRDPRHANPNFGSASLETRIRAAMRRCIADEIHRLIVIMDELDTLDADAEPAGDDEPSLGWTEFNGVGWRNNGQSNDDREDDAGDNGEPDTDREPALGWTDAMDQTSPQRFGDCWRWGEEEDDGRKGPKR